MTNLLQELISFRRKKPEPAVETPSAEIKPIVTRPAHDKVKNPAIARIYREMRRAYQKLVASSRSGYNAPPAALKLVYQQLSQPLAAGDKNAFFKVMDKWPDNSDMADAYAEIMGRLLNSLNIEDVEFKSPQEMWDAMESAAYALDDDEEMK